MQTDFYLPAGGLSAGGASRHLLTLFLFVLIADILNLVYSIYCVITHSSGTFCLRYEKRTKVYICTCVFAAKSFCFLLFLSCFYVSPCHYWLKIVHNYYRKLWTQHTVAHDLFLSPTLNKGIKMKKKSFKPHYIHWLWLIMDILLHMYY